MPNVRVTSLWQGRCYGMPLAGGDRTDNNNEYKIIMPLAVVEMNTCGILSCLGRLINCWAEQLSYWRRHWRARQSDRRRNHLATM